MLSILYNIYFVEGGVSSYHCSCESGQEVSPLLPPLTVAVWYGKVEEEECTIFSGHNLRGCGIMTSELKGAWLTRHGVLEDKETAEQHLHDHGGTSKCLVMKKRVALTHTQFPQCE